jgi:hypothetical protein
MVLAEMEIRFLIPDFMFYSAVPFYSFLEKQSTTVKVFCLARFFFAA